MSHQPVLVREVTDLLVWDRRGTYVDATLGWGGHTEAILAACAPDGRAVGLDRDGEAVASARERLTAQTVRLLLIKGNFADLKTLVNGSGIGAVHGVLFDLGLSSTQLDDPGRGFSFRQEGPLDMRMDRGEGPTAEEILQTAPGDRLAQIIENFGEERWAKRIARRVAEHRRRHPLRTTRDLADCVLRAVPKPMAHRSLARVFQALRIAVNGELEALKKGLDQGRDLLISRGRLVVLSYHSLEDRIVKEFFRESPELRVLTKKPLRPGEEEIVRNPRAKSAKLRAAEKWFGK